MHIIDSHTGGEPTRVILDGGPPLGDGPLKARRRRFACEFDHYRLATVTEPRGREPLVGAVLCEPQDPSCDAGVIFFNAAGYLGMCGHATMGLAVSLYHLNRIGLGRHRFETPVGVVTANLLSEHQVAVENVESFRFRSNIAVEVDGLGKIGGDVAWGGNWFFLARHVPLALEPENIERLTEAAMKIRQQLAAQGVVGTDGAEIDHVEFSEPSKDAHARNFVLCPDGAYDRSPCGTGTSAKLACLASDGLLAPGDLWTQESILGSRFEASYAFGENGGVMPMIMGHAYVIGEGQLHRSPADPFANGILPAARSLQAAGR